MKDVLNLYISDDEECPYLPGRVSRKEYFTTKRIPEDIYELFLVNGWRRSGILFYRNICPDCAECCQMRIPVARFVPTRSHKRAESKNLDVSLSLVPAKFRRDVFDLYKRYSLFKHKKREDEQSFRYFLCNSPIDSRMSLYHIGKDLAAVGWIDVLPQGLSSVYFAFDPHLTKRSLGVFSVVREIALARSMGKEFYYLGFVVDGSPTMGYKAAYTPHERLYDGRWIIYPSPKTYFAGS